MGKDNRLEWWREKGKGKVKRGRGEGEILTGKVR